MQIPKIKMFLQGLADLLNDSSWDLITCNLGYVSQVRACNMCRWLTGKKWQTMRTTVILWALNGYRDCGGVRVCSNLSRLWYFSYFPSWRASLGESNEFIALLGQPYASTMPCHQQLLKQLFHAHHHQHVSVHGLFPRFIGDILAFLSNRIPLTFNGVRPFITLRVNSSASPCRHLRSCSLCEGFHFFSPPRCSRCEAIFTSATYSKILRCIFHFLCSFFVANGSEAQGTWRNLWSRVILLTSRWCSKKY